MERLSVLQDGTRIAFWAEATPSPAGFSGGLAWAQKAKFVHSWLEKQQQPEGAQLARLEDADRALENPAGPSLQLLDLLASGPGLSSPKEGGAEGAKGGWCRQGKPGRALTSIHTPEFGLALGGCQAQKPWRQGLGLWLKGASPDIYPKGHGQWGLRTPLIVSPDRKQSSRLLQPDLHRTEQSKTSAASDPTPLVRERTEMEGASSLVKCHHGCRACEQWPETPATRTGPRPGDLLLQGSHEASSSVVWVGVGG